MRKKQFMKNNFIVIVIIALCFVIYACQSKVSKTFTDYKMISYESKAWVDTINFPTIRIYSDNSVEVFKQNKVSYTGKLIGLDNKNKIEFNNSCSLSFEYSNKEHSLTEIGNLTCIMIEAKHGTFKKL
jgi:ABC-type sugar transport system permease subunit